jgi:D-alanyl-lipoteichoic acid acyltransferase DltB (MBOAT superfamily)
MGKYLIKINFLKHRYFQLLQLFFDLTGQTLLIDFYLVELIHISENKLKKYFLTITVIINIAMLGYFKYANFFVTELNGLFKVLNFKFNIGLSIP